MRAKKTITGRPRFLWMVRLHTPDKVMTLPVAAETQEEATVEAAKFWGISWASAVRDMEVEKRSEYPKRLCPRCGNYLWDPEADYCEKCRRELAVEQENLRRRKERYYREQAIKERKVRA